VVRHRRLHLLSGLPRQPHLGFSICVARQFKPRNGDLRMRLTRLAGRTQMGLGAALIPGGNDALAPLSLSLLRPEALAACVGMVIVIAISLLALKALTKHPFQAAQ